MRRRSTPVTADLPEDFTPWTRGFNDDDAPHFRWFEGGLTNACFNEVDRHVLAGHGAETAVIFEGDRWDMAPGQWPRCAGRLLSDQPPPAAARNGEMRRRAEEPRASTPATASRSTCRTSRRSCSGPKRPSASASSTRRCSAAFPTRPCRTASMTPARGSSSPPMAAIAWRRSSRSRPPIPTRRSTIMCRCTSRWTCCANVLAPPTWA